MSNIISRTFNIGEHCVGGVITVQVYKSKLDEHSVVTIINKEWDFSAGSSIHSDQSKAEELRREIYICKPSDFEPYFGYGKTYMQDMEEFLTELTTSYYADTILTWIENVLKTNSHIE